MKPVALFAQMALLLAATSAGAADIEAGRRLAQRAAAPATSSPAVRATTSSPTRRHFS